jgi:hypothetical protein
MANALVNRYKQLISVIPRGSFYMSQGQIIPRRSGSYELRIYTSSPDTEYGIFVNDKFLGYTTTNAQSYALITVDLDKGENEIKLIDSFTQESTTAIVTTREYATWLASIADSLGYIDENIEQTLNEARLDTASADGIERVFGATVGTSNTFAYNLDTYREFLQQQRVAYRRFGGTIDGLDRAVRAFTTVSPMVYSHAQFGPRWVLGRDILRPTLSLNRKCYTIDPLANINSGGANVTVVEFSDRSGTGSGDIVWDAGDSTLQWLDPIHPFVGEPVEITEDGEYILYASAKAQKQLSYEGPFNITSTNNRLKIAAGDTSILHVTLTNGGARTATQVAADINAAIAASPTHVGKLSAVVTGNAFYLTKTLPSNVSEVDTDIYRIVVDTLYGYEVPSLTDGDAAQTVFNTPYIRGGLDTPALTGSTTLSFVTSTNIEEFPSPTVENPVEFILGGTTYNPVGAPTGIGSDVSAAEIVTVIDISGGVMTLANPTTLDHGFGEIIYLKGTAPQVSLAHSCTDSWIKVNVEDFALLPGSDQTDTINVLGTGGPEHAVVLTTAGAASYCPDDDYAIEYDIFKDSMPFVMQSDTMISIPVPEEILKYKSMRVRAIVYAIQLEDYEQSPYLDIQDIGMSFDDQSSYTYVAPTVLGDYDFPHKKGRANVAVFTVDPGITKSWLRIRLTNDSGQLIIQKVRLLPMDIDYGLCLGYGTTPRSEHRTKTGGFMYVWSPEELLPEEGSSLGTAEPITQVTAHIDNILPDMVSMERFDVSEYDGFGNPLNVKGSWSAAHLMAGVVSNLDVVIRSPDRFSHYIPTTVSRIEQVVQFDPGGPFVAPLDIYSDQNMESSVLLEDGVPVTQDNWQYNAQDEIELLYTPINAEYTFMYDALIRFESDTIDLAATYTDYVWFADWHVYTRPELNPISVQISAGIQFDGNGVAVLPEVSDQDTNASTLVQDNGVGTITIPAASWSYVRNNAIQIDAADFDQNSIYEFTYNAIVSHPSSEVDVTVELRSATTVVGLASATYESVAKNQPIDGTNRYHQMRVTLGNITDIRDARIYSLILKGLNFYGGSVPILHP